MVQPWLDVTVLNSICFPFADVMSVSITSLVPEYNAGPGQSFAQTYQIPAEILPSAVVIAMTVLIAVCESLAKGSLGINQRKRLL